MGILYSFSGQNAQFYKLPDVTLVTIRLPTAVPIRRIRLLVGFVYDARQEVITVSDKIGHQ
jgi:hypothetical protein